MRTVRLHQWLMGAVVATAATAISVSAFAAGGGSKEQKGKTTPTPKAGGSAELGQGSEIGVSQTERSKEAKGGGEGKGAEEEEEKSLSASVDFVLGFGKTPAVSTGQAPPGTSGTGLDSEPSIGVARFTSYSFLFGVGYEFAKGLEAGVRLHIAGGRLTGDGDARGAAVLGNVEIEGGYEHELNEHVALVYALGIALPTAQGTEIPESAEDIKAIGSGIDHAAYDRFAIQKAAQASRGFEENALFEPSRLGIIPKIGLNYRAEKIKIEPWVKLENLVATDSALKDKYVGELVLGANLGYVAAKEIEPTIRVWTNVPVANADFKAVAVVEPQLRMHFGDVSPTIGVLLPFAGTALTDPYVVGVRAGLAARF